MKNNNIKDYNDYNSGCDIAKDITDIMSEPQKQKLSQYPHFKKWLQTNQKSVEVIEKLSNNEKLGKIYADFDRIERLNGRDRLIGSLATKRPKVKRIKLYKVIASVAAAILIISFVLWNRQSVDMPILAVEIIKPEVKSTVMIEPTLILSSGENIAVVDKQLNYKEDKKIQTTPRNLNTEYNTLVIPRKFTFNLTLVDGTKVYLNSDSELRYPTTFDGDVREVFLKGEAYFEVIKDSKPFIVNVDNVDIKVYGTKFNIRSYASEIVETVLLEGSVGVIMGAKEVKLTPNDYFKIDTNNGQSEKRKIDATLYSSWVNGYISYDCTQLKTVLEDIERAYDVALTINIPSELLYNIKISGVIDKKLSLNAVIEMIESSSNVKFIKDERGYCIE